MSAYRWRNGSRVNGDAQVAGEVCERLSQENRLTPSVLVDESEPNDAPLHDMFTWDDSIAGRRWREDEARHIINGIVKIVDPRKSNDAPVMDRAFVSIKQGDAQPKFQQIDVVINNIDLREIMLRDAMREMEAFMRKYKRLNELSAVFDAIGTVMSELGEGIPETD